MGLESRIRMHNSDTNIGEELGVYSLTASWSRGVYGLTVCEGRANERTEYDSANVQTHWLNMQSVWLHSGHLKIDRRYQELVSH